MASVKAPVQVDFPMHALTNPHANVTNTHANVQCVYIVYAKYQTVSVKAVVGVELLAHALSSTIQNYKGQKL